MDSKIVNSICRQIYRQFPDVVGSHPKVQPQAGTSAAAGNILLIFQGTATAADGKKITRIVRVVATPAGKIIKTTTSR